MRYYQIGEASEITGLSRDTLRFYEKKGLIHSERRDNGYRMYSEEELCSLVSILYKRRMNYSLKGIGSESEGSDRLEELKETTRASLRLEEEELRKHSLSMTRLRLTMRDLEDIEKDLGRVSQRSFPEVYVLEHHPSYMDATMSWFRLCSELDGLDMCYLMSRYDLRERDVVYRDTALIFFRHLDDQLEREIKGRGAELCELSGRNCIYTVAEAYGGEVKPTADRMLHGSGISGETGHRELYTINLMDARRDQVRISYRQFYIPVL